MSHKQLLTIFSITAILWTNTFEVLTCEFLRWTCFVLCITELAFVTIDLETEMELETANKVDEAKLKVGIDLPSISTIVVMITKPTLEKKTD